MDPDTDKRPSEVLTKPAFKTQYKVLTAICFGHRMIVNTSLMSEQGLRLIKQGHTGIQWWLKVYEPFRMF